jgi:hypothetical protein
MNHNTYLTIYPLIEIKNSFIQTHSKHHVWQQGAHIHAAVIR